MNRYIKLSIFLVVFWGCSQDVTNECPNKMGDLDNNGAITPHDAAMVQAMIGSEAQVNSCQLWAADVNNDKSITQLDAEAILDAFLSGESF